MTEPTKTQWIIEELSNLKQTGLYNYIRTLSSPQGAWLIVDGQQVLNFCSNNYLGLPTILASCRLPRMLLLNTALDLRQCVP